MNMIKTTLLFGALALGATALGQTSRVTGNWTANLSIDRSIFPKAGSPEAQIALDRSVAQAMKTRMDLNLGSGGTFRARLIPATAGEKKLTLEGKWILRGRIITLIPTKANGGKPRPEEAKPQQLLVDANYKWLRFTPPEGMGSYFQFTRTK